MFTKQFDRRVYVAMTVFCASLIIGTSFGVYILWPSRREAGYMPSQPIPFSHKVHAGDLAISCIYCHSEVEKGPHATVPNLSTCMNCHEHVQPVDENGDRTEGMELLLRHWTDKESVLWNKVNDVADFVYFDHSRHIHAGVDCTECHGKVEDMEHMQRAFGLKMSWCLDCHTDPPKESDPAFARGESRRAPIHCSACHR